MLGHQRLTLFRRFCCSHLFVHGLHGLHVLIHRRHLFLVHLLSRRLLGGRCSWSIGRVMCRVFIAVLRHGPHRRSSQTETDQYITDVGHHLLLNPALSLMAWNWRGGAIKCPRRCGCVFPASCTGPLTRGASMGYWAADGLKLIPFGPAPTWWVPTTLRLFVSITDTVPASMLLTNT
ncbi:hypothetical protein FQZ97_1092350 [compost metagenome]